ncbi:septum formation family protein [Pseudarthrobacter sp. DSP2-3-2b1]|uniref:septum formation family protein n=1 Tax=Pseudarthrobacter sp. DSP2-3-2b1 TaxID=2804661 RepID=UPI003CF0D9D2
MNQQDAGARSATEGPQGASGGMRPAPPKPSVPPTAGLPRVSGPEFPVVGPESAPEAAPEAPARKPPRTGSTLLKVFFAVVLLGVIGGLVWLALWLGGDTGLTADDGGSGVVEISPTPLATPLALPREGVAPAEFRLGDCFKDFDPESLRTTVVACDTPHSAQLVAVFRYPTVGQYPGREALAAKALEACQAARLAPAANDYVLNFQRAYPSSTSWASGDRRVDCYVTADGGNVINASALP